MNILDIKIFHRTQRDLASAINTVIDTYWEDKINESELIDNIEKLYTNNTNKMMKGDQFTTIVSQQCGKRRLEVVERIINLHRNQNKS